MESSLLRAVLWLLLLTGLSANSSLAASSSSRKTDPAPLAHCVALEVGASLRSTVNPRDEYIRENLNKKFTTSTQNRRFIEIANETQPGTNTLFIHNENAVLKKLNDSFQEKNFVTSMNNRYTEILLEKFGLLEGKFPGLEIYIAKVDPYHDFKTSARAIQWKGKAPGDFQDLLESSVQAADKEFTDELVNKRLLRQKDLTVGWYKTGIGDTADRASTAARVARVLEDRNRVVSFDEPWVQTLLNKHLEKAETDRSKLEISLASRIPFVGARGKATPNEQVFDLIRKSKDNPDELLKAMTNTFHTQSFTRMQAEELIEYAKDVDRFSPSLRIEEREIISLDHAPHGGMSADFLGMGSSNLASVAAALARAKNLDHALVTTRQAEVEVTRQFKEKVSAFKEILGDTARCGGDDCVVMPTDRAFTPQEKTDIVKKLAANPLTRKIRISFIEEGVTNPGDRTILATQGEDIEKAMRKSLLAQALSMTSPRISARRLDDFTIGIDMQTTQLLSGKVDMIIGTKTDSVLGEASEPELKILRGALNEAVSEINAKISAMGRSSRYQSVRQPYPKYGTSIKN